MADERGPLAREGKDGAAASSCTPDTFPPHVLREYSLLADGERGVLVGPKGDFAWMCAPRWDSDAVFSSLIGGAGMYAVTPTDRRTVWGGYYEEGSLIWRSRWVTTTGIIECRKALALPGDPHCAVVLRRIMATDGPASVWVVLDARAGFGTHPMGSLRADGGRWTARTDGLHLRWLGAAAARPSSGGGLELHIDLEPGAHHDLVLELSDRALTDAPVRADAAWRATETEWGTAVPKLDGTLAAQDVRHSYAVLRGLTSAAGGMVAAATMSLPERSDAGTSYDYRYAWIRDQSYTGQTIAAARPTGPQAAAWTTLADAIVADVASDCLHPSGRWQRAPDDERIDAALLLPAIRGAVPAHDPRSVSTLEAVEAELGGSGYVYRFRHDARPLEEAEGAFVLCGFLMALATHQQGRTADAVGWLERSRAACGPPACSPRSTTSASGSSEATCPRPLSTRCCSKRRPGWASHGTSNEPRHPIESPRIARERNRYEPNRRHHRSQCWHRPRRRSALWKAR